MTSTAGTGTQSAAAISAHVCKTFRLMVLDGLDNIAALTEEKVLNWEMMVITLYCVT